MKRYASLKFVAVIALILIGLFIGTHLFGCAATNNAAGVATTQPTTQPVSVAQGVANTAGIIQAVFNTLAPLAAFVPGWGTIAAAALVGGGLAAGGVKLLANGSTQTAAQETQEVAQTASSVATAVAPVFTGEAKTVVTEIGTIAGAAAKL